MEFLLLLPTILNSEIFHKFWKNISVYHSSIVVSNKYFLKFPLFPSENTEL